MRPTVTGRCDYRISRETGLARVQIFGAVNGSFIARCANDLQSDSDWSHNFSAIWDHRMVTSLDVTPGDLKEMVDAQAEGPTGDDVVVTLREDHRTLLELYAWRVRARSRPAVVVGSLDEALERLGLEELPPELVW